MHEVKEKFLISKKLLLSLGCYSDFIKSGIITANHPEYFEIELSSHQKAGSAIVVKKCNGKRISANMYFYLRKDHVL